MKLSYAQNLEDYHLSLLFAGEMAGTYVDVGGGHPVADNVSFYFYLMGWRGLVVEPQTKLASTYAHVRPRDRTVSMLAGATDGEIDFHTVDKLHGFSTTVEANASGARAYGVGYTTTRLAVRRLSTLIDEAKLEKIDFLKIDVEGAEADVLAGLDWRRHRPRVILVEAVEPGSMVDASAKWEHLITSQGYSFAFFDNLNRFYVADEAAALKARFPEKPAAWDHVAHLWDCGQAATAKDHPDHALASTLVAGFLASLPAIDPTLLHCLLERGAAEIKHSIEGRDLQKLMIGSCEYPGNAEADARLPSTIESLLQTDRFLAALGRIACMYDGGHLME
ncbi:MAG: FkbM family methyltransferase [Hyphomicrobiaceae bacterium]